MPRKNAKDSSVVAAILQSKPWFRDSGWSLQAISGLPQHEAKILQSLVFLALDTLRGLTQ